MKELFKKNIRRAKGLLIEKNSIKYLFLFTVFGLFPILPFKAKGLAVFIFIILALFITRKKIEKRNLSYLINSVLYITYFISLLYSANLVTGISMLETTVSILIFPIGFVLFSGNNHAIKLILKQEIFYKYIFIISSFLLTILIFIVSFDYGDYITEKIKLSKFLFKLNYDFYWMADHPIYLSIYISVSLLMICSIIDKSKDSVNSLFLIFIGLFQFFILIVLSRKGVILSFILSFILFCFIVVKRKKRLFFYFILFSVFLSFVAFKYTPDTIKRYQEIFDIKSYKIIESHSSTSQRYGIYKCAIKEISNSWLLGYGIGDVNNQLLKCYNRTSKVLVQGKYNTHNQYLGTLLSVGAVGLMLFLLPLFIQLKIFYFNKDYFALCFLLMFMGFMFFENILDRQNGVILFSFLLNYYYFKNTNLNQK